MLKAVKLFTRELYEKFKAMFFFPDLSSARTMQNGLLGVVELSPDHFAYNKNVGYEFETASMAEQGGTRRLFFIRIDSWDPEHRKANPNVDYCIPMAYDGANERMKLTREIPFGGAWSDCREAALLVFDDQWRTFFAKHNDQVVFANPGGESAALFRLQDRDQKKLAEYLAG